MLTSYFIVWCNSKKLIISSLFAVLTNLQDLASLNNGFMLDASWHSIHELSSSILILSIADPTMSWIICKILWQIISYIKIFSLTIDILVINKHFVIITCILSGMSISFTQLSSPAVCMSVGMNDLYLLGSSDLVAWIWTIPMWFSSWPSLPKLCLPFENAGKYFTALSFFCL